MSTTDRWPEIRPFADDGEPFTAESGQPCTDGRSWRPHCGATKADGSQCPVTAPLTAAGYCWPHDPEKANEMAEARRRGGRNAAARRRWLTPEEIREQLGPLESEADASRWAALLGYWGTAGLVRTDRVNAGCRVLDTWLRAHTKATEAVKAERLSHEDVLAQLEDTDPIEELTHKLARIAQRLQPATEEAPEAVACEPMSTESTAPAPTPEPATPQEPIMQASESKTSSWLECLAGLGYSDVGDSFDVRGPDTSPLMGGTYDSDGVYRRPTR
jgi:hypothetical protein